MVGRAVAGSIPPLTLTFYRWVVATAVLLALFGRDLAVRFHLLAERWRWVLLMAVTGVVLFHLFVYTGLTLTTAVNATLMMATTPVVTPIVARVWKGDRVTGRQLWGIAVTVVGTVLVLVRGDPARLRDLEVSTGDLLIVAAVVVWAVYSVALRDRPSQVPAPTMLAGLSVVGTGLLVPLYLWDLTTSGGFEVTAGSLLAIGYVAVFASVLAYLAWNRGVLELGAVRAGPFLNLMPVFGALLAVAFLGETLEWYHLAGVAMIGAGLWLSTVPGGVRRATPAARPGAGP